LVKWARQEPAGARRQVACAHDSAHKRGLAFHCRTGLALQCVRHAPAQDAVRARGAFRVECAAAGCNTEGARRAAADHRSLQNSRERAGGNHGAIQRSTPALQGQSAIQRGHAALTQRVPLAAHRRCQLALVHGRAELALTAHELRHSLGHRGPHLLIAHLLIAHHLLATAVGRHGLPCNTLQLEVANAAVRHLR